MFRDFPLGFHDRAQAAAEAAQCAHAQGKFWEYHDKLFENQGALQTENLKQYADDLDLDADDFGECLDSGRFRDDVTQDQREGSSYGVRGTPAFFVNGRFLSGNQPFDTFARIIDEELEHKGIATN